MKLGTHINILSGYAFDSNLFNDKNEGIPIIRIRDVGKNKVSTYYKGHYNKDFLIYKGDFLVGMDGDFRLAKWQCEEALLNQRVCKIEIKSQSLNPDYLFYFLPQELKKIEDATSFATVKHLSVKKIQDIQIPLPPLEQQKKIAAILDAADTYRQLTKALIAKYDELTQSLFLDMFGDPVKNEKGWEKVELKKICSFKKKNIKPENIEEGENYIALDSIEKVTGKITTVYNVNKGELKSNKFWFDNSYILYGKLRPYLNKVALPHFDGVCSTDIIPIQPIKNKSNRLFITSILRHSSFVAFADERSSGANLPRISPSEVEKYSTINPPLDLQNQFEERVQAIEEQKTQAQASLEKAEELFASLLQKAFNGLLG